MSRDQFEYVNPHDRDNTVTITIRADGSVLLEVEQEVAMDSYNSRTTCQIELPSGEVSKLITFLQGASP
jgi:hypothetical protein